MQQWLQDFWQFLLNNKETFLGSGVLVVFIGTAGYALRWWRKRVRKRALAPTELPFQIIPPKGDVLRAFFAGEVDDPLADFNFPYVERVVDLPESLREWRNLVHPAVAVEKYLPEEQLAPEAKAANAIFEAIRRDVSLI